MKISLRQAFAGQKVGIKKVSKKAWIVSLLHHDSGVFDEQLRRVECAPNPFSAKASTMCPL
jgi:hypothetical protein